MRSMRTDTHRKPHAGESESSQDTKGRPTVVCKNTWAGRIESPCRVVGETPTRYRIEVDQNIVLPRGVLRPGTSALVPKTAVRFTDQKPLD